MSSRQQPYHQAEALSDADPQRAGIVEMGDRSLQRYLAPGSLHEQLGTSRVPLTTARSEGSAATSDQRNWGSYGGSNEPSITNKAGV